jgi:hypothetical protein
MEDCGNLGYTVSMIDIIIAVAIIGFIYYAVHLKPAEKPKDDKKGKK